MDSKLSDPTLEALSADILTGMRAWQLQHPDATLTEIEHALDERWYRLHARMLEESRAPAGGCHLAVDSHPPNLSRLWSHAYPPWSSAAPAQVPRQPRPDLYALLRLLSKLQERSFPPWISNWPCCRGASPRCCRSNSLAWGLGCHLPKL